MVDWINVTPTEGSGDTTFSVTALPNTGNSRTTSITVAGNSLTSTVSITQKSFVPELIIKPDFSYYPSVDKFIALPGTGGTYDLIVDSNVPWTVTSYPNQLTLSQLSGQSGTTYVTVSAGTSNTVWSSTIEIQSTDNTAYDRMPVYQGIARYPTTATPFTIEFIEGTGITISKQWMAKSPDYELYYSINGGPWVDISSSSSTSTGFSGNPGDTISFKGKAVWWPIFIGDYKNTTKYNVYGNVMSLIYGDDFADKTTFPDTFERIQEVTVIGLCGLNILDASSLLLPATTLVDSCYKAMFTMPLFYAPELPATTLAPYCYEGAFPGTMIQKAPVLPASLLPVYSYRGLFRGCKYLKYIKCLATDGLNSRSLGDQSVTVKATWIDEVAPTGTFVKASGATWPEQAIPSGWTIENA